MHARLRQLLVLLCLGIGIGIGVVASAATEPAARTPEEVANELLSADRAFAADGQAKSAAAAMEAMFADDVVMLAGAPVPGFAHGKARAVETLERNTDNVEGHVTWTPVRAGVSADGLHGFTVGYMTLTRAAGGSVPIKYVAYWVKGPAGWRVAVYKRVGADATPATTSLMRSSLPARLDAPLEDAATIARHKASLEAAERAFSDEAQKIGLGPAFAKHGRPDSVNVGPRTSPAFVVGAEAIGRSVGEGLPSGPSPLRWAPDEGSIVASSGDLGVTFGFIRWNDPPAGEQRPPIPFITIWRRDAPDAPWRYIAE